MPQTRSTHHWPRIASIAIGVVLLFWLGFSIVYSMQQSAVESDDAAQSPYTLAGKTLHPVVVQNPTGPPVAIVGTDPTTGLPLTASCTTCHATRPPEPANGLTRELGDFHQGLVFNHGGGTMSCLSCHNPNDYDTLRAANGDTIPYTQVMALCAQCHSKQHTDYQHGAHGGMNGYWDLSQGPRTRHSCIDCHDPHAPSYPQMIPTFKPIDRGLDPVHEEQPATQTGRSHE